MVLNNRRTCKNCRVTFVIDFEAQDRCYRCLTEAKQRKTYDEYCRVCHATAIEKECAFCGTKFKVTGKVHDDKKTCSDLCKARLIQEMKLSKDSKGKILTPEEKIALSNEKWLKNEAKPIIGKRKSFDVLDQEAEYRRVFDERGWKHYVKGRKWDNI